MATDRIADNLAPAPADPREEYQAPSFERMGSIKEDTASVGNNSGSDSGYS